MILYMEDVRDDLEERTLNVTSHIAVCSAQIGFDGCLSSEVGYNCYSTPLGLFVLCVGFLSRRRNV